MRLHLWHQWRRIAFFLNLCVWGGWYAGLAGLGGGGTWTVQKLGGIEGSYGIGVVTSPCARPFPFQDRLTNTIQAVYDHAILEQTEGSQ